jgi:hypothetical protein
MGTTEWWMLLELPMDVIQTVLERSLGGTDTEGNLVCLCDRCHRRVHEGRLDVELRWVDDQWHAFCTEIR